MLKSQAEDLSLIIPVYRNEENIPELISALTKLNMDLDERLTVTFVIDGSPDKSGQILIKSRANITFHSRIVFHSRNFGSFAAVRTGLEFAKGRFFAVMAADLQESPELIITLFEKLEADEADIVFGTRSERNDGFIRDIFSRIFWSLYRRLVLQDMPRGGVDIFACNTIVRDNLLSIQEPNSSLIGQLFWLGFRRSFVPYKRHKRTIGKSGWRLSMKIRYVMDSVISFTDLPVLVAMWTGLIGITASAIFALITFSAHFLGLINVSGYTTIALLITMFGSVGLLMQGIIGSYVWRAYENTKRRPLRLISKIYEPNISLTGNDDPLSEIFPSKYAEISTSSEEDSIA